MSTLNVTNISDGTNSTSTTNVVKGSAKAWVNFNGTGTVAIREAYNVGSVTDIGTGTYTINFTTAMPDANYSVSCSTSYISGVTHMVHYVPGGADGSQKLAGSLFGDVRRTDNNVNVDLTHIDIQIFR